MKISSIIKIILVIGICITIFGAATVKGWINVGVDKIEQGVEAVKSSDLTQDALNKITEAKDKIINK